MGCPKGGMYIVVLFRDVPCHCRGTTCSKNFHGIPQNLPRTSTAYHGTLTLTLGVVDTLGCRGGCHNMPWGCHGVPWGVLCRLPRGLPWYHPFHATACHGILCHAMGWREDAMVCHGWYHVNATACLANSVEPCPKGGECGSRRVFVGYARGVRAGPTGHPWSVREQPMGRPWSIRGVSVRCW